MKIITDFCSEKVLSLWSDVFGKDEAELERVQIDGTENKFNTDVVFSATEGDDLLGTVHTTISKAFPEMAGVSGVCTSEKARGKGISKILFEKAMNYLRENRVKIAFLGTSNPVAAKVYSSYGFEFIPGTYVMVNSFEKKYSDYLKEMYNTPFSNLKIAEGTPELRIPIIPLVNFIDDISALDINTGIVGRALFSQKSCMGLFPRYLKENYYCAVNEDNVFGALMSVKKSDKGMRADFFSCKEFDKCVPALIKYYEDKFDDLYFQVADIDERKIAVLKNSGYTASETITETFNGILIPMTVYKKRDA